MNLEQGVIFLLFYFFLKICITLIFVEEVERVSGGALITPETGARTASQEIEITIETGRGRRTVQKIRWKHGAVDWKIASGNSQGKERNGVSWKDEWTSWYKTWEINKKRKTARLRTQSYSVINSMKDPTRNSRRIPSSLCESRI